MDLHRNTVKYWLNSIGRIYTILVDEKGDSRVKSLPFVHNPLWIFSFLAIYLLMVLYILPRIMQDRKPFQLKQVIVLYNIFQIVGSSTAIHLFFKHGWTWHYFYQCKAPDYSDDVDSVGYVYAAYFTYLLKLTEMIETAMYALRKKNAQISRFHVYHHCYAAVTAWGYTKYGGGSMLSYTIVVNSIVHVFMYGYYLGSIFATRLPFSLLPVKKFVTILQITQLVTVLFNLGFALRPDCPVPVFHCLFHGPNMTLQIKLFVDFYRTAYAERKIGGNNLPQEHANMHKIQISTKVKDK